MVVRVLLGELRGSRWVVGAGTHGCWLGTYERPTLEWVCRLLRAGAVGFDVGANVGLFTLLASRLVGENGTVVAFEPLPENLVALTRHLRINGLTNVRVIDAAVSAFSGTGCFGAGKNPATGGLSTCGTVEVKTVALDELVRNGAVPAPDFLKIDVEGAELQVLQGAREVLETRHPAIVLSAHGTGRFQECSAFLGDLDYELHVARDGSRDGDYLLIATRPGRDS